MVQAKLSTYAKLCFLEIEPNLLQIHLILDFPKSEQFSSKMTTVTVI